MPFHERRQALKTALLLTLATTKSVSELHALSVIPACAQFAEDDARVTLKVTLAFVPKIQNAFSCKLLERGDVRKVMAQTVMMGKMASSDTLVDVETHKDNMEFP